MAKYLDESGLGSLWQTIKNKVASENIGDIKTTARAYLGENWLLCNGGLISKAKYPELFDMFNSQVFWKEVFTPQELPNNTVAVFPLYNNMFFVRVMDTSQVGYIVDVLNGEVTFVSNFGGSINNFIGVDWDGERWVSCYVSDKTAYFYTSADLHEWSEAITLTLTYGAASNWNNATPRFLFDGVAFHLSGYDSANTKPSYATINKELTEVLTNSYASNARIHRADGLFIMTRASLMYIYEPGATSSMYTIDSDAIKKGHHLFKYADNKYLVMPGANVSYYICVYDKEENDHRATNLGSLLGLGSSYNIKNIFVDGNTNEFVIEMYYSSSYFYVARITIGDDMFTADNYRVTQVTSSDLHENPTYGADISVTGNKGYGSGNTSPVYFCGPDIKTLPSISIDGAYTYIKAKEA